MLRAGVLWGQDRKGRPILYQRQVNTWKSSAPLAAWGREGRGRLAASKSGGNHRHADGGTEKPQRHYFDLTTRQRDPKGWKRTLRAFEKAANTLDAGAIFSYSGERTSDGIRLWRPLVPGLEGMPTAPIYLPRGEGSVACSRGGLGYVVTA